MVVDSLFTPKQDGYSFPDLQNKMVVYSLFTPKQDGDGGFLIYWFPYFSFPYSSPSFLKQDGGLLVYSLFTPKGGFLIYRFLFLSLFLSQFH